MNKEYLIMIPGWGMRNFSKCSICDSLCERFKLIFIDWSEVKCDDDLLLTVTNLIDKNNLSSFSILGWSLGSLVALKIASLNKYNINSLILLGSTPRFVLDTETNYMHGWNKRIVERMISKLHKDINGTLKNFISAIFSKSEIELDLHEKYIEDCAFQTTPDDLIALSLGLNYLINEDLRKDITNIHIPTLLIHGGDDQICPPSASSYLNIHLPNSTLKVVENCGHAPFFTHKNMCSDYIYNFYDKLSN